MNRPNPGHAERVGLVGGGGRRGGITVFRLPFLILQIWDFYDLGISRAHGVNLKDFSAEGKSKLGMFNVCHLRQQHQLQDLF